MIDLPILAEKYNLEGGAVEEAQRHWEELKAIYSDYLQNREKLKPHAKYLAEMLATGDKVHSVKMRLKNPEHLIAKIIRRELSSTVNRNNYREEITDLIGLRALHLFKEDWLSIHEHITRHNWNIKGKPVAKIRKGDPEEFIRKFEEHGCEIDDHPAGYRSVHYLVQTQLVKEVTEIQVRTIFEEGWSEIDHQIRYPDDLNNNLINHFLVIFNRLAGSADEMGSFVRFLQFSSKKEVEDRKKLQQELDSIKERINQMPETKQKSTIKSSFEDLSNRLATRQPSIGEAWEEFSQQSMLARTVEIGDDEYSRKSEKKKKKS